MKDKVIKIIDYIVEGGILAIIFFVPLYFAIFYKNYNVFIIDKIVLFRLIVETIFIFSILKVCLVKKINIFINKRDFLFFLPFFILFIIATFFSEDKTNSFWGSYWRQQGLFTYLHYFVFFIILVSFVDKKEKVNRIINTILITSLIAAIYGLLQWLGLDYISWSEKVLLLGGRITSTLGQPIFFGNFILLVIFLSFYKIISKKNLISRAIFCSLTFFLLICLVLTFSRGAWIGLFFGIIFLIFLILSKAKSKKPIISAIIFLFFILVVGIGALLLYAPKNYLSVSGTINMRLRSLTDFSSGSMGLRFTYWKAGLNIISEKPFLGYGPENQQSVLIKYYEPSWGIYEKINSSADRFHNEWIDLLFSGGVLLFSSFLVILGLIFYRAIKYTKFNFDENILLIIFLLVSIFSFQLAILFSFSEIVTNVYFWLYLALILILINKFKNTQLISWQNIKKIYVYICWYAFILILIGVSYIIYNCNFNFLKADYYFFKARSDFKRGEYAAMLSNYISTIELNNQINFYKWFFINDYYQILSQANSLELSQSVIKYLNNNFAGIINENSYEGLLAKAKVLTIMGKFDNIKYYREADDTYKKIISISPWLPDSYKSRAELFVYQEDYAKAINIFKESLSVLPDINSPKFNEEHREENKLFIAGVYEGLGYAYFKNKDYNNSLNYYKKILGSYPYRYDIFHKIAYIYSLEKNYDQAVKYSKRASMLDNKNYFWPFLTANYYNAAGNKAKALEYITISLKLKPDDAESKKLLSELKEN